MNSGDSGGLNIWLRDITERKNAEAALRDSESLYRSIFAALHEGIVFLDPGVQIFACNERAEAILGLTRDQIMGRTSADPRWRAIHEDGSAFPGEDHPSSFTLATGRPKSDVVMGVHKPDGSLSWISINSEPVIRSGENRPIAAVVSFADITANKLAESALRESESRFRKVFEDSPLGSALIGPDLIIRRANPALHAMMGYAPGELEHFRVDALVANGDRADAVASLESVFSGQESRVHMDRIGITREGAQVHLSLSASLLRYENEAQPQVLVMFQDMTARYALEAELRQTQRLENVGRLAGAVAHDFNNLLTVINGYADLIRNGLPEQGRLLNAASQIRVAGSQAADLTQRLLALGRKQPIAPAPMNLNSVVSENLAMLRHLMGEQIHVETHLQPDLPLVRADRGEMHMVLLNLAMNAFDAMPEGGTLTVRTMAGDGGNQAVVEVADTGIGMNEETRLRVFDAFFSTKGPSRGTGLGLSIVYRIIQQYKGKIEVLSEPGQGTSFLFQLPALIGHVEPESLPEPPVRGGDEAILIVDDHPGVGSIAQQMLRAHGYSVRLVSSADQALAVVREANSRFDLLLTDVVMPGMNGVILARTLSVERSEVAILMMSAYSHDVLAARNVGDTDFPLLPKPFTERELLAAVRDTLDSRSVPAPPRSEPKILLADDNEPVRELLREFLMDAGFQVVDVEDGPAAAAALESDRFDAFVTDIHMPGWTQESLSDVKRRYPKLPVVVISGGMDAFTTNVVKKLGADAALEKADAPDHLARVITELLRSNAGSPQSSVG